MNVRIHTNEKSEYLPRFEGLEEGRGPPWSALTFFGWIEDFFRFRDAPMIQCYMDWFERDGASTSKEILFYSGNAYQVYIQAGLCFIQLEPYLDQTGMQKTIVSLDEVMRVFRLIREELNSAKAEHREAEFDFEVGLLAEADGAVQMFRDHCGDPEWEP